MEKYRRWTDSATGINPFIQAKVNNQTLLSNLLSSVFALLKLIFFIPMLFPFCCALLLQSITSNKLINSILRIFPFQFMCVILGVKTDDESFCRIASQNSTKGKLILSNSSSILDAFYYLSTLNSPVFIVSSPDEQQFNVLKGISLPMKLFSNRQPFFNHNNKGLSFETVVSKELNKGNDCVLFYEGIKTNGLGTIKISKVLSDQLFRLQQNYLLTHLKYTSQNNEIFSLTDSPLKLLWNCLKKFKIGIKVRSRKQMVSSMHSGGQIRHEIDSFIVTNGGKLLETNPAQFEEFYSFFKKTRDLQYK